MSRIRADKFVNNAANGAPQLTFGAEVPVGYGITGAGGINIAGVATAASFSGNATTATTAQGLTGTPNISVGTITASGNVSVGGTLTYEDVTNIDSIGIITARSGIEFGVSGAGGTITSAGAATFTGDVRVNNPSGVASINLLRMGNVNNSGTNSAHLFLANGYYVTPTDVDGTGAAAKILTDGNATFSTVTDSIGSLRRLGVNAQSGAYAFVVGDAGKIIRSAGSGSALTLNQNIFTAGDMISVFNVGSGNNTVVQGTGVTLYNTADAATGTRTIAAKGMCTIVCTASNEFAISGSQLT